MRRLARTVFGACAVAAVATAACANDSRPAATIHDPVFVRRANAICAAALPTLRAPEHKATSTTQLRPANLDRTATALAAVVSRLRALPVRTADRAAVKAWLADWDRFVATGHRYAAAVRADDPARYTKIDDDAVRLTEQIGRFARGNHIDDCVL